MAFVTAWRSKLLYMKKRTEILPFNGNINFLVSEGRIIAVVEMQNEIISSILPYRIEDFELPKNYRGFAKQCLAANAIDIYIP